MTFMRWRCHKRSKTRTSVSDLWFLHTCESSLVFRWEYYSWYEKLCPLVCWWWQYNNPIVSPSDILDGFPFILWCLHTSRASQLLFWCLHSHLLSLPELLFFCFAYTRPLFTLRKTSSKVPPSLASIEFSGLCCLYSDSWHRITLYATTLMLLLCLVCS